VIVQLFADGRSIVTLIHHAIFAHGSYALLDVRMITVALL
jgi:hypothetical protein